MKLLRFLGLAGRPKPVAQEIESTCGSAPASPLPLLREPLWPAAYGVGGSGLDPVPTAPLPCLTCKWWVRNDAVGAHIRGGTLTLMGECRARSPRTYQIRREGRGESIVTRYPLTGANEFCGQHKPAPEVGTRNAEVGSGKEPL